MLRIISGKEWKCMCDDIHRRVVAGQNIVLVSFPFSDLSDFRAVAKLLEGQGFFFAGDGDSGAIGPLKVSVRGQYSKNWGGFWRESEWHLHEGSDGVVKRS